MHGPSTVTTACLVTALSVVSLATQASAQEPGSRRATLPSAVLDMRTTQASTPTTVAPGAREVFAAAPDTYAPRYGRPGDRPARPIGYGYTDAFIPSGVMFVAVAPPTLEPSAGVLGLRIQPAHAQVFIDGVYAGTAADFAKGRPVEAGPHRIEIRADGYETHAFDRRVIAGEASLYRQTLWEARSRAATPVPRPDTTAVRRPYYVIPGCYGGNTPPTASQLPPGCDASNVRTREYMVRVPAR